LHKSLVIRVQIIRELNEFNLSPAFGGILNIKWRGVHPEGETGGEVKKHKDFVFGAKDVVISDIYTSIFCTS